LLVNNSNNIRQKLKPERRGNGTGGEVYISSDKTTTEIDSLGAEYSSDDFYNEFSSQQFGKVSNQQNGTGGRYKSFPPDNVEALELKNIVARGYDIQTAAEIQKLRQKKTSAQSKNATSMYLPTETSLPQKSNSQASWKS